MPDDPRIDIYQILGDFLATAEPHVALAFKLIGVGLLITAVLSFWLIIDEVRRKH